METYQALEPLAGCPAAFAQQDGRAGIEVDVWTPTTACYNPRPDYGMGVGRYMELFEAAEPALPRKRGDLG